MRDAVGRRELYLLSPVLTAPNSVFRGSIDLATQKGTGHCFLVDATTNLCANGERLQYALIPCQ